MLKIELNEVNKDYTFYGHVYASDLSDEQLKTLGLDRSEIELIQVEGSFDIISDSDHYIESQIESVTLVGKQVGHRLGKDIYTATYCELLPIEHPRRGMNIVESKLYDKWYPMYKEIELDVSDLDLDSVCYEIENCSYVSDWDIDYQSGLADHLYDSYKDSLYD